MKRVLCSYILNTSLGLITSCEVFANSYQELIKTQPSSTLYLSYFLRRTLSIKSRLTNEMLVTQKHQHHNRCHSLFVITVTLAVDSTLLQLPSKFAIRQEDILLGPFAAYKSFDHQEKKYWKIITQISRKLYTKCQLLVFYSLEDDVRMCVCGSWNL